DVCRHVDALVEELAEGVEEEDNLGLQEQVPVTRNNVANDVTSKKEGRVAPSQARVIVTTTPGQDTDLLVGSVNHVSEKGDFSL
ncbi:hypothetical protein A2U01_0088703, partial [Trifolium medium]|nr:hypothetical protein [Trifolium medium]